MTKKYKILNFQPILLKEVLKKIWQRYGVYLDFEKEWKNFLDICDYSKNERIFSLNNFLITEFLITNCGLRPSQLSSTNCYCSEIGGKVKIGFRDYNNHKKWIDGFLKNFR